jgi:uncharacterized membrane protein YuzA (DUF378 family)
MAEVIAGVFSLLAIVALIVGFIGLVKPSVIKQTSRLKAFGKSMLACLVFLIVVGIAAPKYNNKNEEIEKTVVKEELFQGKKELDIESQKTQVALSTSQKRENLQIMESILAEIKKKRSDIQHVVRTQPMRRGESGSVYLAKWNGMTQKWGKDIQANHKEVLGEGMVAPFCSEGAFNTRLAVSELSLIGIGYIHGDASVQEKNLDRDIEDAEKAIAECKANSGY